MVEHLNVGGTPFSVDKEVLSRDPASMLAVMFGGHFSNKTDRFGRVFIDRDGERFRYVLDFLTDGKLHLLDNKRRKQLPTAASTAADRLSLVRQLEAEAHYFNLQSMFEALLGVEQQIHQEIFARSLSEEPIFLYSTIKHPTDVWCLRLLRQQGIVLTGDNDGRIRIWSIKTGALLQIFERLHRAAITCLDCEITSAHGQLTRIVSGSLDRTIRVWDVQSGACTHLFTDHESALHSVQLDGNILASSAGDGTVRMFDLQKRTCLHMIRTSSNDVHVLLREKIAIVTAGCAIWVWNTTTPSTDQSNNIDNQHNHASLVCSMVDPRVGNILSVSWNGLGDDEIVTGTSEGGICFWSLSRGAVVRSICSEIGAFAVNRVIMRNGIVYSCSFLPTCACIWDAQSGKLLRRLDSSASNGSAAGMLEMDIDDGCDDASSPLICLTTSRFQSPGCVRLISLGSPHI